MDPRRVLVSSSSSSTSSEQFLIDEVRYLHSLWHLGPPPINPNTNNNPSRSTTTTNITTINTLLPTISTDFKKQSEKKKRKERERRQRKKMKEKTESKPVEVSEVEWPCEVVIPESQNQTGWPELVTQIVPREISAADQIKMDAFQFQQKGLKASQDFFLRNVDSEGEDEEEEEEEDEEDLVEDDDGEESEEFKFFLGVFTQDSELRSYYEKNYESGEFCCLVCGGIGKKSWKRFKNCVALVQHSRTVSKTKQRRAHRAFGQVLCRVLGWEFERLPNIVLSSGDPLGRGLAQGDDSPVGHQEVGDRVEESVNPDNGDGAQNEELCDKAEDSVKPDTGGGDQNEELRDIAEESVNLDNGVSAQNQNEELRDKAIESVNPCNEGSDQNEELPDKAVEAVDATDNNLTSAKCETGRKEDDANYERKDHNREIVDGNVTNSGEEMDWTANSKKNGTEHQEQQNILKEIIDTVKVKEELVDQSG